MSVSAGHVLFTRQGPQVTSFWRVFQWLLAGSRSWVGTGGREMTAGKCRAKLQLGGRNEDVNEGLKAGLGTYHGGK